MFDTLRTGITGITGEWTGVINDVGTLLLFISIGIIGWKILWKGQRELENFGPALMALAVGCLCVYATSSLADTMKGLW